MVAPEDLLRPGWGAALAAVAVLGLTVLTEGDSLGVDEVLSLSLSTSPRFQD